MERARRPKTLEESGYLVKEHPDPRAAKRLSVFHRISEKGMIGAHPYSETPELIEPRYLITGRQYFEDSDTQAPQHSQKVLHTGLLAIALIAAFV